MRAAGVMGDAQRASGARVIVTLPSRHWREVLPDARTLSEAAARAALARVYGATLPPSGVELSLVLGSDRLVRGLNRRWRGQDRATNVLSFASGERVSAERPLLLGDVVLAFETVAREAAQQGKSLADHLAHLVTHGVLHLLGFDHEAQREARRMEALERSILAGLGVPDPYCARDHADV